jgi:hypothetical protein
MEMSPCLDVIMTKNIVKNHWTDGTRGIIMNHPLGLTFPIENHTNIYKHKQNKIEYWLKIVNDD